MVDFIPQSNSQRYQAYNGDSYVAAIEFSQPVKAMALTTYGNSTQPNSSNNNQLQLFSQKQLRPVWHLRQDVEAHLVETKVFSKNLALK